MRVRYDAGSTRGLVPLLRSIAREIEERHAAVERLEEALEHERGDRRAELLVAELSGQRRELRHAYAEVCRLGCAIVGTEPLTFRIPLRGSSARGSLVYQARDECV